MIIRKRKQLGFGAELPGDFTESIEPKDSTMSVLWIVARDDDYRRQTRTIFPW